MPRTLLLCLLVVALLALLPLHAVSEDPAAPTPASPVVVELFSSQG
ncbi:MAG: hypothetical protein HUU15_15570 [Candidatus Brocadiae bacterium]|nr:hypothetical protein [Candidatus Brocadiia bacterium]